MTGRLHGNVEQIGGEWRLKGICDRFTCHHEALPPSSPKSLSVSEIDLHREVLIRAPLDNLQGWLPLSVTQAVPAVVSGFPDVW